MNSLNQTGTKFMAVAALSLVVTGCAPRGIQVARVAADTQTDLSGKWNDTDAKLVSKALISDCFDSPWLIQFVESYGKRPAVRVRSVVNKTDEHIDSQVFIKNIEKAMINSGKVRVLAQAGAELGAVESEQDRAASGRLSDDSDVSIGNETGANYVVAVRVTSILDQVQGKKAKFYKVNFELLNSTSGEKAWIGDHEIKKLISQGSVSW
ncbi:MAG: penicillin-binding protein activator LpoB [Myxococcota bacterium]|nr:penicillin-binding protein activator LpoB [Myxococcota bacterium]